MERLRLLIPMLTLVSALFALGCSSSLFKADQAYNDGTALAEQVLCEEAIPHFTIANQLDPGFADAYFNMGNSYKRSGILAV